MNNAEFINEVNALAQAEEVAPTTIFGDDFASKVSELDGETEELDAGLISDINAWHAPIGDVDWFDIMKWLWAKVKQLARWLWDKLFG